MKDTPRYPGPSAVHYRLDMNDASLIPITRPTLCDRDGCLADFAAIWESGWLSCGPFTARFEQAISQFLQVGDAVCVGSCTSGLMLLQRALALTGEVIIPTFTWTATGTSLLWNNLVPVFVDARGRDGNLDCDLIAAAITPRTSAICPVATFGVPPDCERIESIAAQHGVAVYYDSAQAFGATYRGRRVGGFGVAEVFSMSPTKVLTAAEMGVITTGDVDLAARLRRMRDYGKSAGRDDVDDLGLSVRPSEFHAALGLRNLPFVDELIARRGRLIALYRERLAAISGLRFPLPDDDRTSANNYMMVFVGPDCPLGRDLLFERLREQGVCCKRYFHPCLHQQTVFRSAGFVQPGSLAVAEQLAQEGLALPLFSHMTEHEVERVVRAVAALCGVGLGSARMRV